MSFNVRRTGFIKKLWTLNSFSCRLRLFVATKIFLHGFPILQSPMGIDDGAESCPFAGGFNEYFIVGNINMCHVKLQNRRLFS